MDLTNNKTPFGLLTPEEQEHLRNWPHGVEVYCGEKGWLNCDGPRWLPEATYRTKPAPVTKVQWFNDYGTGAMGLWHDSRENADKNSVRHPPRIAVIRREWTEGQPPKYFTEDV